MSESDVSAVGAGRPAVGIVRFRARCLPKSKRGATSDLPYSTPFGWITVHTLEPGLHSAGRTARQLSLFPSSLDGRAGRIRGSARVDAPCKFAQAHRAMPSAVRSALVRSALERLSGAWLRDAAAFGLLQGRSWVVSWPPGPPRASRPHGRGCRVPAVGAGARRREAGLQVAARRRRGHHRRPHPQRTGRRSAGGRAGRPAGRDPGPLRSGPFQPQQARHSADAADASRPRWDGC